MKNLLLLILVGASSFLLSNCAIDPTEIPDNSVVLNQNDSVDVEIKYSESITINKELTIYFKDVAADSRCPIDVMCVWEGDAETILVIQNNKSEKEIKLHTKLYPREMYFEGYLISIKQLLPLPKSTVLTKKSDYKITLTLKNAVAKQPFPVVVIDESFDWVIKHDMLVINDLKIEGSIITASVSHSGGCKDHDIQLFAKSGILKSNPPQLNLFFSHNANSDLCEAYITRTIKFNLSRVKDYLGSVGGFQKIILNFYNTDGKPAKQSPKEFNY